MRYKSYRKRHGSKVVKMKFQSFVDIATQADNMKIISVNAGGYDVIRRLAPFFGAYKYYKLGGVSIKLIPASTLPVDPTGLSYEAGENTVDPRDQLTPGMCRITNGEDILEDITGLTGDQQRQLYDNMLLDPRWYKWMLQSGVKRFGKPKYWQIGQLHQDKWPGASVNYPFCSSIGVVTDSVNRKIGFAESVGQHTITNYAASDPKGIFQTGHRGVLGWMPTDSLQEVVNGPDTVYSMPLLASPPEVELFKILMPPMHKTNYYYRMFITETVYFREPIVMNINGFRPLDVFHTSGIQPPLNPTVESMPESVATMNMLTGGNDGSR
jgi:hypothetical protein